MVKSSRPVKVTVNTSPLAVTEDWAFPGEMVTLRSLTAKLEFFVTVVINPSCPFDTSDEAVIAIGATVSREKKQYYTIDYMYTCPYQSLEHFHWYQYNQSFVS